MPWSKNSALLHPTEFLLETMPCTQSNLIGAFIVSCTGGGSSQKSNAVWAIRCTKHLQTMLRACKCGCHERFAPSGKVTHREWFATPEADVGFKLGRIKKKELEDGEVDGKGSEYRSDSGQTE